MMIIIPDIVWEYKIEINYIFKLNGMFIYSVLNKMSIFTRMIIKIPFLS